MSQRQRCIAIHNPTGDRCRRNVSKNAFAEQYKLCRTHCKSVFLTLFAPDPAIRERLASSSWTNTKELRPFLNRHWFVREEQ